MPRSRCLDVALRSAIHLGLAWFFVVSLLAVPACAQTATTSVTQSVLSGGLNVSATLNSLSFGTVTLSGVNQAVSALSGPSFRVIDASGSNAGWNLTFSSTSFSDGTGVISETGFTFNPTGGFISTANASTQAVDAGNGPREPGGGPQALSTPVKALTCTAGFGKGTYLYTPLPGSFQLQVPATTVRGTGVFRATLTITINSGP